MITQELTLEDKIGQMLLVGFQGLYPPDYILEWLAQGRVSGVILFARNVDTPEQVAKMNAAIHQAAKYPALVAIDQEGGNVARLREGFSESPGAMALAAAQNGDDWADKVSQVLGTEMQALGINWTYAPAVDITYNAANPTVGTRSFGTDKEHVSQMAISAVKGFQGGGVAACAKHFPGLGNTSVDTHLALPSLDVSEDFLIANDLLPYHACIGAGVAAVMTTHTIFTTLDPEHPATLSPVIIQRLLRGRLKFDGVVTTDCMEMKAIQNHYGAAESAVLAALAGVDAILFSHTRSLQEQAYEGLLAAAHSGRLSMGQIDAANARIAALKARFPANSTPSASQIRLPENVTLTLEAAQAGIVHLRGGLPIRQSFVLVEFAAWSETEVVEKGGKTGLATVLNERLPNIPTFGLLIDDPLSEAKLTSLQEAIQKVDTVVLATRNAHLLEFQTAGAKQVIDMAHDAGKQLALVALRNPYDLEIFRDADVMICTCGDSTPSLHAAVGALLGDFVPSGRLPVEVTL